MKKIVLFLGFLLLVSCGYQPIFSGKDSRGPASSKGLIKVAPSTENIGREFVNGMIK